MVSVKLCCVFISWDGHRRPSEHENSQMLFAHVAGSWLASDTRGALSIFLGHFNDASQEGRISLTCRNIWAPLKTLRNWKQKLPREDAFAISFHETPDLSAPTSAGSPSGLIRKDRMWPHLWSCALRKYFKRNREFSEGRLAQKRSFLCDLLWNRCLALALLHDKHLSNRSLKMLSLFILLYSDGLSFV